MNPAKNKQSEEQDLKSTVAAYAMDGAQHGLKDVAQRLTDCGNELCKIHPAMVTATISKVDDEIESQIRRLEFEVEILKNIKAVMRKASADYIGNRK